MMDACRISDAVSDAGCQWDQLVVVYHGGWAGRVGLAVLAVVAMVTVAAVLRVVVIGGRAAMREGSRRRHPASL